ncbi:replication initiation factor domain-containing protein [Neisseria meningitidis]|uniref:replication initiation factor domain-containing protein n=1 Tax=Neisseria meningitidis TaxID=487 RepID=UPI002B25B904|nr:replication initiation factor domain-containing protein [Neisseria meningitidis]
MKSRLIPLGKCTNRASLINAGNVRLSQAPGMTGLTLLKKAKTLTIGSKHSSVFCRIYDKAKEQGDTSGRFLVPF